MPTLADISHRKLMATRICDLGLAIEGSEIERYVRRVYDELDRNRIRLHPKCYLADEWGCPDGVPVIGVPFYLADPVLVALEREMMLDAEGDDPAEMMKLLRHESGHTVNYAYGLHERPGWARVFGPFHAPYPEHYKSRQFSRQYVRHLNGWYAQRHPDEDFAETFAVWLSPVGDWRIQYAGWPALSKLEYVDRLMHSIGGKEPSNGKVELHNPVSRMTLTLAEYYESKRAAHKEDLPDVYDGQLKAIFSGRNGALRADSFLRLRRREFIERTARWTGERRYVIAQLYAHLTSRCRKLRLRLPATGQAGVSADFSALLSSLVMNYYYRGTFVTEP